MNQYNSNSIGESLPQQINKYIIRKILEGKLKAGDKIIEEEISRELNTSRAPVREALYLLQVDGIVERIPRKGTVVKDFSKKDIDDYLTTLIGIIQLGIDLSQDNWKDESKSIFQNLFLEAEIQFNEQNMIEYQFKAEQLFSFIVHFTDNKALIRFYEEADHILNVFAQTQMSIATMKDFHDKISGFTKAMLSSDFKQAKVLLEEAIYEGSK